MQHYFFAIPALMPGAAQDEMNAFCAGHRVLSVERQFVAAGLDSHWAICVAVIEGGGLLPGSLKAPSSRQAGRLRTGAPDRVDYRAVLNASDFTLFAAIRAWRKTMAAQEGVPIYAVLTNEQMAEIARRRVTSLTALGEIDGIGPARIERYGAMLLALVQAEPAAAA